MVQRHQRTAPAVLHAGRAIPRVYNVSGRSDLHQMLTEAVVASGGTVLYASGPQQIPVYLGVEDSAGRRLGLMVYPFRMTKVDIRNRPTDEVRGQLRYGGEASWRDEDHWVARDLAGVDTTLLLGIYADAPLFVGLDPFLYDPLPLGISAAYIKDAQVDEVRRQGWLVWERENHAGARRAAPRTAGGLETLVAFEPSRLLDYAAFEQRATGLGLDPPLRYAVAVDRTTPSPLEQSARAALHDLESSFDLSANEILDIIHSRMRLEVAVKGGVAEHHLERQLEADPAIRFVQRLDQDAQPDFEVELISGAEFRVECKNASPEKYANGDFKVEVQKTRATRDDPAGRLYRPEQFDVVAACLYSATRRWEFRYKTANLLERHAKHPDRLAATHRVDSTWHATLQAAINAAGHTPPPSTRLS